MRRVPHERIPDGGTRDQCREDEIIRVAKASWRLGAHIEGWEFASKMRTT
jgi:hypothetical protein